MGTLNRAVTTVKKLFGFEKKTTPPNKISGKTFTTVIREKKSNPNFIPNYEKHPTLKQRRAKRRSQGKSRDINSR
ncbi:MAG: hypothetical protein WC139_13765 [Candidatus Kapaibacterium sp.]